MTWACGEASGDRRAGASAPSEPVAAHPGPPPPRSAGAIYRLKKNFAARKGHVAVHGTGSRHKKAGGSRGGDGPASPPGHPIPASASPCAPLQGPKLQERSHRCFAT